MRRCCPLLTLRPHTLHALLTLNRSIHSTIPSHAGDKDRRPFMSSDCDNLQEAEKWRREIIKESTRKIAEIQNGTWVGRAWCDCCGLLVGGGWCRSVSDCLC